MNTQKKNTAENVLNQIDLAIEISNKQASFTPVLKGVVDTLFGENNSSKTEALQLQFRFQQAQIIDTLLFHYERLFGKIEDNQTTLSERLTERDLEGLPKKRKLIEWLKNNPPTDFVTFSEYQKRLLVLMALANFDFVDGEKNFSKKLTEKAFVEKMEKNILDILLTDESWVHNKQKIVNGGILLALIYENLLKLGTYDAKKILLINLVNSSVNKFFFAFGHYASPEVTLDSEIDFINRGMNYIKRGAKRKKTTEEKDHQPVINLILQKDKEGCFIDCKGKPPGALAAKIARIITEHNTENRILKKKGENIHPYSKDQILNIIIRYFVVKKGVPLQLPLTQR